MAIYDVVNGVYRKVAKKYDIVDGVYRNVKKAYDPVDGVYRQYFRSDIHASDLAVGSEVYLNVDGVQKEFLVVHQGVPDTTSYYNAVGTWLMLKGYFINKYDDDDATYSNSYIHSYLNDTYFGRLEAHVQAAIKQVKIPHTVGTDVTGYSEAVLKKGSDGLSTKIFLPSVSEVRGQLEDRPDDTLPEGSTLDYFYRSSDYAAERRNVGVEWWTRTKETDYNDWVSVIGRTGFFTRDWVADAHTKGIRPTFVIHSDTLIDQSTGINIIA